jgi:5-methylcytosine-specific restriction protein A
MSQSLIDFTNKIICERVGLGVESKMCSNDEGKTIEISPLCIHKSEGFSVELIFQTKRAFVKFIPGNFAKKMLEQMGMCATEDKSKFSIFASYLNDQGTRLQMQVNGGFVDPSKPQGWPLLWNEIKLQAQKFLLNKDGIRMSENEVVEVLLLPFFQMLVCLLPIDCSEPDFRSEEEGKELFVLSKRYERSPINRDACIMLKGCQCSICGFIFGEKYGNIGEGFIEIHHTTPLSQFGVTRKIDIIADLVPLCSNCHRMVHRRNPPFSIDEIKEEIGM